MRKNPCIILIISITIMLLNIPSNLEFTSAVSGGDYPYQPDDIEIIKAFDYLKNQQSNDGGIGGITVTAWAAMAISASNLDINEWGNLIDYLEQKSTVLDQEKATDWERHAMAIIACNENPNIFAGIDFIQKIIDFYDGTQFDDEIILFDDYFGIISLISAGFKKTDLIIQNVKSYIINKQNSNGGWGDADSTAAAIMSLMIAGEDNNSEVIKDGLSYLKTFQSNDGGFHSWGDTNAASTAWAVMAITASNNHPTSKDWEKNGNNPISFLLSLQQEDGSFNWSIDQKTNPEWMTSYAITALLGKYYPVKINESVYQENNRPNKPNKPSGPNSGEVGIVYTFSTSGADPDNDRVQYRFDWGDNKISTWSSFVSSGKSRSLSKKWDNSGTYKIRSQTRDIHGLTSNWSNEHTISISEEFEKNYWSGFVRIEGKNKTIWSGDLTVYDSYILAKNTESGEINQHYISYPSLLGALEKAADIGKFSYSIDYLPSKDSFSISAIEYDTTWWHYLIDYNFPIFNSKDYRLNENDKEILFCYLEKEECHALKISIDKLNVKKNEEIIVSVFNEKNNYIGDAEIFVGSDIYITDKNGNSTILFKNNRTYQIYAEKKGFVRSEKVKIEVKKGLKITKPNSNSFYLLNYRLLKNIKKTFIIGAIDIEVETSDDITIVDFYINDILVFSDNSSPFEYTLNEKSFFNKTKILVKSYRFEPEKVNEFIHNILKIIEILKSLYEDYDINSYLEYLNNYLDDLEKTIITEEDTESLEIIVLNLFPSIH
jgi:prenyltransferase beta subunit